MNDGKGARTLDLVFLGPPGSGKGTQAERIAERFGLSWICPGQMLRQEADRGSEIGRAAQAYMKRGELVPDELVLSLISRALDQAGGGFILDGFPRSVGQARALDRMLEDRGRVLSAVIYFDIPDQEVVRRIGARRICPRCGAVYNLIFNPPKTDGRCDRCSSELVRRKDDEPEAVRKRLEVYRDETLPVVDYYEHKGVLERIDASRALDDVTRQIEELLARLP